MLLRFRKWLVDLIEPGVSTRARPGQYLDAQSYPYGAFRPELAKFGNFYAISPWVHTAVARMVEAAGSARLKVHDRRDVSVENPNHPILEMIGPYGMANDNQSHLEFLEQHLTSDYLLGNVYWYWFNGDRHLAGPPTHVYQLDAERVKVVPGSGQSVDYYIYSVQGHDFELSPLEVTHFRRPNPYSAYYGLSPFVSLYVDVTADRSMAYWNRDFFGNGVSLPAGMLVVPPSTSEAEMKRIELELSAKHGGGRRATAVVKAAPGAAAWFDGGLKHHDYEFMEGREFARAMVFDAVGLPRGLLSESSTEAHARVAERQLYSNVQHRLLRLTARLNADGMGFWPLSNRWATRYPDPRMQFADWQQELYRQQALNGLATVNERRMIYDLPALPGYDDLRSIEPGAAPALMEQGKERVDAAGAS